MGGLRHSLCLILPAVVMATATEPSPVEFKVRVSRTAEVTIRLVYRKGVVVGASGLPKAYLKGKSSGPWVVFDELSPAGKRWVVDALWPDDDWRKDEIRHYVRWPELESVWLLSALFSGHGQNYDRLQDANSKNPEKLRKGDIWRIPKALQSIDFGGPVKGVLVRRQPEDDLEDEARITAFRALLAFGEDGDGKYAAYRLRKGEALYSSVVMRYTDRVDPKDVTELANAIAARSGIEDVRSIPPGTLIKIPVEHLADPFQLEGTTALAEERAVRAEVRRTVRLDAGPRLRGVTIVLDAGHGGIDPGARANGIWESDFVYDIAMRVRGLLQQESEAGVSSTIRFPGIGFDVRERIATPSRSAQILTTPPMANDGERPTSVSVHLRWVLANDIVASQRRSSTGEKTLFISFHADSLHPSARGTMVYVPGAAYVPASFSFGNRAGVHVAEIKRGGKVVFSGRERLQGEARSRLFAQALIKALQVESLPIHSNRPIRNVIHRGGTSFVPAVIRHSAAGAKVLVEVGNLQNEEDADDLRDPGFRERYAMAVVKGIRSYFGK
jgi:N-acetylmuramoyl-L-alanine amidase